MAITVSWYVEHRIIKVAATGNISPEMVREMSRQVVALLDASSCPLVHTLWDMSAVEQYPKILSELQAVTRPYLSHPRLGWAMAYGIHSSMLIFLGTMLLQMFKIRSRIVETEAEAIAFLREQDDSLRGVLPQPSQEVSQ